MSELRVWAPGAREIGLKIDGAVLPMTRLARGWWGVEAAELRAGTDYFFVVDGDALPDPRSQWQPNGVLGPSRIVDHDAFRWSDQKWQAPPLRSGIVYEMHVGTFTSEGTFESAIARLDHLTRLGVTHVELMPVQEFSGMRGWGYDGADLFAPHHAYGGPDGLKRFVDASHAKGLAVLLDVVYNHLGPVGNFLSRFGPYFTDEYSTPWGPAINFDGPGSAEVRRFLCDNARMWLRDYHVDGLRIDAIHAMFDRSAQHFLAQLSEEVDELEAATGRHLALIAESDLNDPRVVTPREAGGYGIDAQWSDDFHHALHAALTGERAGYYGDFGSLGCIAKALTSAFVYDGGYSCFRKRDHGKRPRDLAGWRFLGYLQTHDQVGNRARGERSSQLMSLGRLKIGAALVMCSPFVPMLFEGEEFGATTPFLYFTAHEDPEVGRAVSEGRRREFAEFGWKPEEIPDPQDERTFARSKLDWEEVNREPHASLLEWHRELIALRKKTPALMDGRMDKVRVEFDEKEQWLMMRRGPVAVICNFGPSRRKVPVEVPRHALLCSEKGNGGSELAAESVTIATE